MAIQAVTFRIQGIDFTGVCGSHADRIVLEYLEFFYSFFHHPFWLLVRIPETDWLKLILPTVKSVLFKNMES